MAASNSYKKDALKINKNAKGYYSHPDNMTGYKDADGLIHWYRPDGSKSGSSMTAPDTAEFIAFESEEVDNSERISEHAMSPTEIVDLVVNGLNRRLYEALEEMRSAESIAEARVSRVNRVRGGKVQRRRKVANKSGYTVRGGKVTRMKAGERRNRRRAQRKGARKRKALQSRINRKRKVSMRKRKRIGG